MDSIYDALKNDGKARIIQEIVPGKQITLAHIIANPDPVLYTKLGLDPAGDYRYAESHGRTGISWKAGIYLAP